MLSERTAAAADRNRRTSARLPRDARDPVLPVVPQAGAGVPPLRLEHPGALVAGRIGPPAAAVRADLCQLVDVHRVVVAQRAPRQVRVPLESRRRRPAPVCVLGVGSLR